MKLRMLINALFKIRNISVLLLCIIMAYSGSSFFGLPEQALIFGSMGIYGIMVVQTLMSPKFHEDFNRKQKIRRIQDMNYTCLKLSAEAKRHASPSYLQRLRKMMDDKDDIVNSFIKGEYSYLKEKIVEQTLNLVISYIKLMTNYCIRSKELSSMDVSEIANRINMNNRKLSFVRDPNALEDIKRVIEMDEKIINRLKEEKKELERISAKLDYMESSVNMFKHQILSNIESEEMLEKLETVVNEAAALDNVLEDRRKNRIRM